MANRGYEEREIRLALEWAHKNYPGARIFSRYRILTGPLPSVPGFTEAQIRGVLRPTGLMADLVIVLEDSVLVVEAKTDNETQAIGQLLHYVYLLKKYPELQEFPTDNLIPVILVARAPADLIEFADSQGVHVAVYSPDWLQPFLERGYS